MVQKSVLSHGGLENSDRVKTLSFTKKTIIYNQDGSVNKQHLQDQFFNLNDGKKASISFPADSLSYQLDQKGMIHKRKMNSVHKLSGEEFKKIDPSIFFFPLCGCTTNFRLSYFFA